MTPILKEVIYIANLDLKNCIIGANTPIETTRGLTPRVYFNN